MSGDIFRLTVLGTRGSMPVSGNKYAVFGGATSCYMVEAGDTTVFLDAGSGLIDAPSEYAQPPVILLSHLHLDHVLGLGMYPRLSQEGKRTELYMPAADGREARKWMDALYSPPFWPCSLADYRGDLACHALSFPLQLGELKIEGISGNHPGGCVIFRLTYQGKRIVYATDYEYEEKSFKDLVAFSEKADLLLYDAQYTEEEYERARGFGHSTARKGLELFQLCGAKRMLFIHHNPLTDDSALEARETEVEPDVVNYARQGMVIEV